MNNYAYKIYGFSGQLTGTMQASSALAVEKHIKYLYEAEFKETLTNFAIWYDLPSEESNEKQLHG